MNAVTKTVRITATIKPPMPGHILESLERVWADLDPTKDECRSHYGAWRNVYPRVVYFSISNRHCVFPSFQDHLRYMWPNHKINPFSERS
jgi:hypothetical protein